MASIADLVGGFQQGALFRAGMQERGEKRQDAQLKREGARRALAVEMGGVLPEGIGKMYDPYEFKLGQMFRGVFSGEARRERRNTRALADQGYTTASAAMASPGVDRFQQAQAPTAIPVPDRFQAVQTQGSTNIPYNVDRFQDFADGGSVAEDLAEEKRRRGERVPREEALIAGDIRRSVGENFFPNTRGALTDAAENADTVTAEAYDKYGGGARGAGAATRAWLGNAAGSAVDMAGSMLKDAYGPIIDFGAGALGFTGQDQTGAEEAAAGPGKGAAKDPAAAAAIKAQAPAEEPAHAESPSSPAGAATPQRGPFVGPPEPDQAAAQIGNVDIMPDEMPAMSTRDWVAYRSEMVPALMMQGATAEEAHKQVSAMQHEGFTRYAQQAAMMLQAGNQKGAARALKAAYQYFPNGNDVRFGFQNGHLVGLAIDEETGKVSGKPQVITPEYLGAMVTNFQDPAKFLAWTKDWRDEAFRERQYNEVTKPTAQGALDYQGGMLDVARQNAASNAISSAAEAQNARARAAGQGPSESDYGASSRAFREAIFARGVDDQVVADDLAQVMSTIRTQAQWKDLPDDTIIKKVMEAYENGTLPQVKQRLGIR